jgi:hypothetical protein
VSDGIRQAADALVNKQMARHKAAGTYEQAMKVAEAQGRRAEIEAALARHADRKRGKR